MLPRMLKAFSVYVDGRGYVGRIATCKLPELKVKAESYRGGGMDAPVDMDMGMEKLDVTLDFAEYDPELIKLFGLYNADVALTLRGALQRQGEVAVGVEIRLQGGCSQITREDWKAGEKSNLSFMVNCNRYAEKIAGETIVDIDLLAFKRVIGAVDTLESVRANI